jgi:hypothetical protein
MVLLVRMACNVLSLGLDVVYIMETWTTRLAPGMCDGFYTKRIDRIQYGGVE